LLNQFQHNQINNDGLFISTTPHTQPKITVVYNRMKKSCRSIHHRISLGFHHLLRGAGGNRTRVQTRKQYAFYMFIPRLDFRVKAGSGPPTFTLAS